MSVNIQLKDQLRTYFNGGGFERWSAIYGTAELSRVRQSIREGHAKMLAQAEAWLTEHMSGGSILDAGCGTGLFSIRMAQRGFNVTAVDIAPKMVNATRQAAISAGVDGQMSFHAGDIETVLSEPTLSEPTLSLADKLDAPAGFDAVVCFDVLVHYPEEAFVPLCTQLAQQSSGRLLITYAPYSRLLATLHWIGGFFPKGERRTEIQMIRDVVVADALAAAGMTIQRSTSISQGFYHVKLLEASR